MSRDQTKLLAIGGLVLVAALFLPPLLGWAFGWEDGRPWMMGGFGWMWFMPVYMVAFWGLIIWAVVALVQGVSQLGGSRAAPDQQDSALEILKRRYARGEIGKEEFEEKKRDLA